MFQKYLLLIPVILLFFSGIVFAEEKTSINAKEKDELKAETTSPAKTEETDAIKMKEIVVTATRTEKEVTDAPADVVVITKEEIKQRNVQSLDGALKTVSGLYSRRELEFSTLQPVINIRGIAGQNRTLVMKDGIPLNEPRVGAGYFDGIAVDNVDRIEVVKGPFSSLYGGYAMGGVVNVITKMPEKREFVVKSGYGNAWHSGEAFENLYSEYISYGDRFDKLSVFAGYSRKGTSGYPYQLNIQTTKPPAGYTGYETTTGNTGNIAYNIGDKGDGYAWNDGLDLKAQYSFSTNTKLGLSYLRDNIRYGYDPPHSLVKNASGATVFTYTNGGTVREASYLAGGGGRTRSIYDMVFETELGTVKGKLQGGLVDVEKSFYVTPGTTAATRMTGGPGTYTDSPAKEYYADLQFTAPIFSNQLITWGAFYRHDSADGITYNLPNWKYEDGKTSTSSPNGGKSDTYALFLQDEIQLSGKLIAYLGGRLDFWKTYDGYNSSGSVDSGSADSFSPKAALVYKIFEQTTARLSGGRSFRPPSLYELYSNYVGSTYTTNANPNLKPETTLSWDASIDQKLWSGAKVKVTYFENYMSDLIYTSGSGAIRDRVNVGKAKSSGVEVEIEQLVGKYVRLFSDYTYTDATITENSIKPQTEGKRMTDVPQHMLNLGIEGKYGAVSGSLIGRYVGKRYSTDDNSDVINSVYTSYDPFFTADAKISYALTRFMTLSAAVNNIFDEDYYTYYKSPGRSWYTQLEFRF